MNPTQEALKAAEAVRTLYDLMSKTDKNLLQIAILRAERKASLAAQKAITAKEQP